MPRSERKVTAGTVIAGVNDEFDLEVGAIARIEGWPLEKVIAAVEGLVDCGALHWTSEGELVFLRRCQTGEILH